MFMKILVIDLEKISLHGTGSVISFQKKGRGRGKASVSQHDFKYTITCLNSFLNALIPSN